MEPVRTCIGCRGTDSRSSLVRIVVVAGTVEVDHSASIPGRGAWLHPRPECWQAAIVRKAVGRALRAPGAETAALTYYLHTLTGSEAHVDGDS